jgi:hypothetical protein
MPGRKAADGLRLLVLDGLRLLVVEGSSDRDGGRVSEPRRAQAELARLARLLGREPATLSYLESIPPRDLERLREQVTEVLFEPTSGGLGRLAAASRVLPVALVATLGERVFGAVLSARIAGLLDPDRGSQVAAPGDGVSGRRGGAA